MSIGYDDRVASRWHQSACRDGARDGSASGRSPCRLFWRMDSPERISRDSGLQQKSEALIFTALDFRFLIEPLFRALPTPFYDVSDGRGHLRRGALERSIAEARYGGFCPCEQGGSREPQRKRATVRSRSGTRAAAVDLSAAASWGATTRRTSGAARASRWLRDFRQLVTGHGRDVRHTREDLPDLLGVGASRALLEVLLPQQHGQLLSNSRCDELVERDALVLCPLAHFLVQGIR